MPAGDGGPGGRCPCLGELGHGLVEAASAKAPFNK